MIRSLHCRDTARLFADEDVPAFRVTAQVARRKLIYLDTATAIGELRVPPGNRLEALKGDRKGQWSIRVDGQWRICFKWREGGAEDVEIVDYR